MQSLSPSDVQFYERKIKSIEADNALIIGENTQLRKQVRDYSQYRIKYDILLEKYEKQIQELKNKHELELNAQKQEIISAAFRQKQKQWREEILSLEERFRTQAELEAKQYKQDISSLRDRLKIYECRDQEFELCGYKLKRFEKEKQALLEQIEDIKDNCNRQKQQELESVKTHLTENFREKLSNQKQQLESRIYQLERQIVEIQLRKDNQCFNFPKNDSKQTADIDEILEKKGKKYQQKLNELQESLNKKNAEIMKILQQRLATESHHREELNEKNNLIRELENTLMEKEKYHEIQLFNMIQRQTIIKQKELKQLHEEIKHLKQTLQKQKSLTLQRDRHYNVQLEQMVKKFEDERKKILDQKRMHQRKISDLSLKLKQADGDRQFGETQLLINSIKDIDGKQDQMGGYQNGVVFLERQLKRCQLKVDERTRTINKLYQEINEIRGEMDKELREAKQQAQKEKKDLTDKILALEEQNNKLFDKIRQHTKNQQRKERQAFKQKIELEEQNQGLKELVEELQRDYKRVIQAKKGAEASYRSEREKNITNVTDTSSLKKQKWLELEKQKKNLEVIYRDRQEQNKMKYQQEIDEKTNLLNRLKQDYELTKKENELLKKQNQKYADELEANKQNNRLSEYNKKVASLSLELALTQNIYDSIIKAKSGAVDLAERQSYQSDVNIQTKQQNEPSSPGSPQFPRSNLLMSFCKPFQQ